MNTKFVLLALAAFAATTATAEDECANSTAELTKLAQTTLIKAGTNYAACKTATTFSFVPISGEPTTEILTKMCATPECGAAMKEILAKATTLLDCIAVNSSTKNKINILRFMTNYDASCAAFTPAPTPSPETPAPTTATPETPAPTTATPETPAPTTATPTTPTPTTATPETPAPTTPEPTIPKPSC